MPYSILPIVDYCWIVSVGVVGHRFVASTSGAGVGWLMMNPIPGVRSSVGYFAALGRTAFLLKSVCKAVCSPRLVAMGK